LIALIAAIKKNKRALSRY